MTSTILLILFFGFGIILIGFGLILGYLIFGKNKETNRAINRTVVVERDSNLLGTAAAVAGGVIAGELIADAIEEAIEEDIGENDIGDAVDDITDF